MIDLSCPWHQLLLSMSEFQVDRGLSRWVLEMMINALKMILLHGTETKDDNDWTLSSFEWIAWKTIFWYCFTGVN